MAEQTQEFTFPCASRGYHEYEPIWSKPTVGEELTARIATGAHEKYMNAIALDRQSVCVGHLPREITRFTRDVIRKRAQVTCKVTSELSRTSLLDELAVGKFRLRLQRFVWVRQMNWYSRNMNNK